MHYTYFILLCTAINRLTIFTRSIEHCLHERIGSKHIKMKLRIAFLLSSRLLDLLLQEKALDYLSTYIDERCTVYT